MSKRRDGCTGKVRHKTKEGACIASRKLGPGVNVYLCKCGSWHTGRARDPAREANRISWLLQKSERDRQARAAMKE